MPNEKKDTQSAWIDIAVFAAVAAFFLFSAHSLTKTRAHQELPKLAPLEIAHDSMRSPASQAKNENVSIKTIDVGCMGGEKTVELSNAVSLLRLKGSWCEKDAPLMASGRNDSSGSEIVTFSGPADRAFTTSYFPLSEGPNKISFELKFRGGKAQKEHLSVIRSSENK